MQAAVVGGTAYYAGSIRPRSPVLRRPRTDTSFSTVCHDAALVLDDRGIEVVPRRELLGAALEH
jgi:hypothetical protein